MERKEAIEWINALKAIIEELHVKRVQFGKFDFPITIRDIRLAKVGDLVNKPEKRAKGDKQATPFLVELVTSDTDSLLFVIEDTTWHGIHNGIALKQNDLEVRLLS